MATEMTTGYGLTMSRSGGRDNWVRVTLRKHMWSVGRGSRSRAVATTGFYAQGMGEREIVESALREILRAYCDELG